MFGYVLLYFTVFTVFFIMVCDVFDTKGGPLDLAITRGVTISISDRFARISGHEDFDGEYTGHFRDDVTFVFGKKAPYTFGEINRYTGKAKFEICESIACEHVTLSATAKCQRALSQF